MSKSRKLQPARTQPRWLWILAAVLLVIAGAFIIPNLDRPAAVQALPAEVNVDKAYQLRESGAFVLDVRQPDEWNEAHIPGATLIPLDQLETRLAEVPRDQEVLVYCRSGNRSKTGRDILLNAGFQQVTSMSGGIREWSAAGYPTQAGQ